jgi:MbtH protein
VGAKVPEDDGATHVAVVNDEEQHSIWPAGLALPPGWHATGFTGTEEACLDHVAAAWRDIAPRSVRRSA